MSADLNKRSYKELQELAKNYSIPANAKRDTLVKAIKAYFEKDQHNFRAIINQIKLARAKRKKASKRNERKAKSKDLFFEAGHNDVDSTSTSVNMQDLVPYTGYAESNQGNSAVVEQNEFVNRLYSRQHSTFPLDNNQFRYNGSYSISNQFPTNQLQPNHVAPVPTMMPYSGVSQKDSRQNYVEYNTNYSSYHSNAFYRQSCAPFSWMDTSSPFYSLPENYYSTQLPAAKLFDPKIVSSSNYPVEHPKLCPAIESEACSSNIHGVPSVEFNCSTDLLPNIPQFDSNAGSHENVSSSWTQNSLIPTYINSVEFSPMPNSSFNTSQDDYSNLRVADNESINAEVDSASDAETLSLGDLLDLDNIPVEKPLPTDSGSVTLSQFSQSEQNSSVVESVNSYHPYSNSVYYNEANSTDKAPTNMESWTYSALNANQINSSVDPSESQMHSRNSELHLPAFSTFLPDSRQSTCHQGVCSECKTMSPQPRDLSFSSNSEPQPANLSVMSDKRLPYEAQQSSECNYIDGTSCISGNSILRDRLTDSNFPELPVCNQTKTKTNLLTFEPSVKPGLPTKTSTNVISSCFTKTSIENANTTTNIISTINCSEKNTSEKRQNELIRINSTPKNDVCSPTSKATQIIYEKETLHRSKIICTSKSGIEENIVQKLVKFIIPNESNGSRSSQPVKREKISKQFISSVIKNPHVPCVRACGYKFNGCAFEAKANLTLTHEKKCKFQTIYCPSEACSWSESLNTLIQHIYSNHEKELNHRQQFLYTIDRNERRHDGPFYTFYQIHNNMIFVIRLHIDEDKCIATVQFIPEIRGDLFIHKNVDGIMEFICFPDKRRVKTWKGLIQPYSDAVNKFQKYNTIQIDVKGSEFIALYVSVS